MEIAEKSEIELRILKAAFEMFRQRGFKSVSMDDIAQHLGMSKKTLYKWFRNKDQVVYDATVCYLRSIQEECECYICEAPNALEELFRIMALTKQVFSDIHPSIFYDLQRHHPDSWELWVKHKSGFMLEKVKDNIRRGIKEGLYRKDLDVEVLARMRLALIELPFNREVFPSHEFNISQVQLAVLEHYMLGMATLKGHKLINEYKQITEEE